MELRDYKQAIEDFNKAIGLNSKLTAAFHNRGSSKYILKDKTSACIDWEKASELEDIDAFDLINKYCK